LIHVRTLPRLHELYLDYTLVTGSGLIHLEGIPLERLSLAGTQLRDEELQHLQRMTSLRALASVCPETDFEPGILGYFEKWLREDRTLVRVRALNL
jgi:hypothetical protein